MFDSIRYFILWLVACLSPIAFLPADPVSDDELGTATSSILINKGEGPLFVSLGADCVPAMMIKDFGKRQAAFPFDWLMTVDTDALIQILDRNFQDFTNANYLAVHPIAPRPRLVHNLYHMEFRHDWHDHYWLDDVQCQEEIEKLQIKYQRRIARFQQLANYTGPVVFIRQLQASSEISELYWFDYEQNEDPKDLSVKLYDALKKAFPHLDFKLMVINRRESLHKMEILGNITIYHFTNVNDSRNWSPLFDIN